MNDNLIPLESLPAARRPTNYPWAKWKETLKPGYALEISEILNGRKAHKLQGGLKRAASNWGLTVFVRGGRLFLKIREEIDYLE